EQELVARKSAKCKQKKIDKLDEMIQAWDDEFYEKHLDLSGTSIPYNTKDTFFRIANYVKRNRNLKYYVALRALTQNEPEFRNYWTVLLSYFFQRTDQTDVPRVKENGFWVYVENVDTYIRID
ncbi:MAG: hypothetical protein J6U10_01795, partial [Lachnospiraceae bacterium]|nr:hypothetical protein [Lachnospiraceae bacterium]